MINNVNPFSEEIFMPRKILKTSSWVHTTPTETLNETGVEKQMLQIALYTPMLCAKIIH